MRVLVTADPELPVPPQGYGGIERIVDGLCRELLRSGCEVTLVAHKDSSCPVSLVPWPGEAHLQNTAALFAAARRFKPDVIHSFSRLAYLTPLLPFSVPKIMSYQRHTGGPNIRWALRLTRGSLRFTGCSEFICRMGRQAGGDWDAIPNFVDLEKFRYTAEVPPDAPLLFLSRVEAIKGADLAIAIARQSGRRLILAGNHAESGPEAVYWNEKILPFIDNDQVVYAGEVGDARKAELLAGAAALIVPIQWDEPFGIVFAEALAAGTPIISCPRGALPEIVRDGQNGYLIHDVAEGVQAVQKLAGLSREFCRRDAERFSTPICVRQYLDLYNAAR